MMELLVGLIFVAILGFWWDSLGARQAAREAGRRACMQQDVQFLDDTVAIHHLRLQRNSNGRLAFYREYRFEYSLSGEERRPGSVDVLGRQVLRVELGWEEF